MRKEKNFDNRFDRHPRLTILVVIAIPVLIGLIGFFLFYHNRVVTTLEKEGIFNAAFTYRRDSAIYHHDFVKNQAIDTASWGQRQYKLRTNSLGFKDVSIREVPLASDHYRILFIGDSFTEGIGLPFEKTFAGRIGKALKPYNVEVLNAAVVSYSPIIYWRKIKYLIEDVGLKFDEVIVYIDISDAQDEARSYQLDRDGNVTNKVLDEKAVREEIVNRIRKNQAVNSWDSFLMVLSEFWPYDNGVVGSWTTDPDVFESFGKAGLEQMTVYMDKLYVLLRQHQITLKVAVYPWPTQLANNDCRSIQAMYWKSWCKSHGVKFINYFDCLCDDAKPSERVKTIRKYYIQSDSHLNEAGHHLFARVFIDRFIDDYRLIARNE